MCRVFLNRENLGKEVGPNGQDEKPSANEGENDVAPLFNLGHASPQSINQSGLGGSDGCGQRQNQ